MGAFQAICLKTFENIPAGLLQTPTADIRATSKAKRIGQSVLAGEFIHRHVQSGRFGA